MVWLIAPHPEVGPWGRVKCIGGLIAFAVVALASFSEKAAAHASPIDRGVARILLFIVPVATWVFLFPLLGMDVDIRIGGKVSSLGIGSMLVWHGLRSRA